MDEYVEYSDDQLVDAVLDGDRAAFAAMYDRYADHLFDFCHSVLRDRDEAADAVQDTFVLVAQRLAQLNDPDRLRPWLYAVARSVALRKVRARRRVVLDEVEDMADTDPGPDRAAEQGALRDLVWHAAAGLSERDRALLDLHVRQGLDGAELGAAMGVSPSHAYVLLSRLRDQVERSLGALLIARQGRADCTELDALLSGWDGRYTPLMRKRVARHVDSCDVCADRRRIMVSPFALLATVPLVTAPVWLRDRVLDNVELAAFGGELERPEFPDDLADELLGADAPTEHGTSPVSAMADEGPSRTRQRGRIAAAAAAVLALAVITAAVAYWRSDSNEGVPISLDLPDPPLSEATVGPPTSADPPSSARSSSSAAPAGEVTTTDPVVPGGVEDPGPDPDPGPGPGGGTTTRPGGSPPDPPDPPDPGDTTRPEIVRASASPTDVRCGGTASFSADVTDDVGVTGVSVTWSSGEVFGSTELKPDGSTWFGSTGQLNSPGSYAWTVTATDAAGNQVSQDGGKFSVSGCGIVG